MLGLSEIADLANVSTARLRQLRLEGRFPRAAAKLGGRAVYDRAEVLAWVKARKLEKPRPGRPPRTR